MADNKHLITKEKKEHLNRVASVVRALTLDAIEKAKSGHPGMVLGCAELGALLYSELLQHDPSNPGWMNRDRFILSAGHGSMFLYSLLHLSGYEVSMDDIKNFRSLNSKTPGHPEYRVTPGVETTTGPLGQGVGTAVGIAIAQKHQAASYNSSSEVFNNCTVVLAGDGDMMEGVVHEAVSLAGTLELDNLILFYDNNHITIDGDTSLSFTEDIGKRFEAAGWGVLHCDGYDYDGLTEAFHEAKFNGNHPTLIITDTIIGKGAPHFENTSKAHSGAMGSDEIRLLKQEAGLPVDADFFVPAEVYEYFEKKRGYWKGMRTKWEADHSELLEKKGQNALNIESAVSNSPVSMINTGDMIESRTTSSRFLELVQDDNPSFFGGSADLASPCLNGMKDFKIFSKEDFTGNFINFGVREHAMAAISNGITLYEGYRAFCSTFLSFVDYLRPALRLSALMELPVTYILAYDSVHNGEDGPTHQPVEQLPSIRAIPNLVVMRPADGQEGIVCTKMAMKETSFPVACITTRQKLECFDKHDKNWEEHMELIGAYIVKDSAGVPAFTVVATGSEVSTAIHAIEGLASEKMIRIVSMPCREYFLKQNAEIRSSVIHPSSRVIVVEAAVEQGWSSLSDSKVEFIGVDGFGASAPGPVVAANKQIDSGEVRRKLQILCS